MKVKGNKARALRDAYKYQIQDSYRCTEDHGTARWYKRNASEHACRLTTHLELILVGGAQSSNKNRYAHVTLIFVNTHK